MITRPSELVKAAMELRGVLTEPATAAILRNAMDVTDYLQDHTVDPAPPSSPPAETEIMSFTDYFLDRVTMFQGFVSAQPAYASPSGVDRRIGDSLPELRLVLGAEKDDPLNTLVQRAKAMRIRHDELSSRNAQLREQLNILMLSDRAIYHPPSRSESPEHSGSSPDDSPIHRSRSAAAVEEGESDECGEEEGGKGEGPTRVPGAAAGERGDGEAGMIDEDEEDDDEEDEDDEGEDDEEEEENEDELDEQTEDEEEDVDNKEGEAHDLAPEEDSEEGFDELEATLAAAFSESISPGASPPHRSEHRTDIEELASYEPAPTDNSESSPGLSSALSSTSDSPEISPLSVALSLPISSSPDTETYVEVATHDGETIQQKRKRESEGKTHYKASSESAEVSRSSHPTKHVRVISPPSSGPLVSSEAAVGTSSLEPRHLQRSEETE
jgi:hypothetical protein